MSSSKQSKSTPSKPAPQAPTGEKQQDAESQVPAPQVSDADGAGDSQARAGKSREELIREAAYRRFEQRGAAHGEHERDWLDAESEIGKPDGNS
jgi:hypothetical protein